MRIALATLGIFAFAGAASASVTLTFDDPGVGAEFTYDETTGTLEYTGAPVDFVIDGTDEGIAPVEFAGATFTLSATVSPVTVIATPFGDFVIAEASADFAWSTAGDETILSGTFESALLTLSPTGFNLTANDDSALSYLFGEAATDYSSFIVTGPVDANWTLTDLAFPGGGPTTVPAPGGPETFADFEANSSFTGTLNGFIPTPGSAALAVLAGFAATRRRRA
ncbi:MAG: hypothetical protein AAGB34_00950 [Planctomycetota bacterium]